MSRPPTPLAASISTDSSRSTCRERTRSYAALIALEEDEGQRYRKLVISDGRIVGAILLGYSQEVAPVRTAITRELDISSGLEDLRTGDWGVLGELTGDEPLLPAAVAHPGSG